MTSLAPLRVLQVGPGTTSVGGMSQVAAELQYQAEVHPGLRLTRIDSGGGRGPRGYLGFLPALAALAGMPADVVHLHLASGGSALRKAAFAALARRRGLPYVVHLHGGGFANFYSQAHWAPRVVDPMMAGAAAVVVLGEGWRDWATSTLPVDPDAVVVVPNGSRDMGPGTSEQKRILYVGRLEPAKGVDLLVRAAAELLERPGLQSWTVHVVGPAADPPTSRALETLAARHPGRVEVTGPLGGEELREQFRRAGIFCLPSRAEALPLTLLEAMSAGTAVVVSAVGSVPEVVSDGVDGVLLPPGDVAALTDSLADLMEDAALRDRLAQAARRTWESRGSAAAVLDRLTEVWARSRRPTTG